MILGLLWWLCFIVSWVFGWWCCIWMGGYCYVRCISWVVLVIIFVFCVWLDCLMIVR